MIEIDVKALIIKTDLVRIYEAVDSRKRACFTACTKDLK